MHLFPDPRAVNSLRALAGPLEVLYCHGCCDELHDRFHPFLASVFSAHGLKLRCDPFPCGTDVQVAMRNFRVQAVVFHADMKSVASSACNEELATATVLGAPILTLCDGVPLPTALSNRIAISLPSRAMLSQSQADALARQAAVRAEVRWVLEWFAEPGRSEIEREGGAAWLAGRPRSILAENFLKIVSLHRGADEDPIVSTKLAEALERTNLRRDARPYLVRWHEQVTHPLSQRIVSDILSAWEWKIGESNSEFDTLT